MDPADAGSAQPAAWTYLRLGRIAAFVVLLLLALDFGLAPMEREMDQRAVRGALRNSWGSGIFDASRRMVLEHDPAVRSKSVLFVGSSVTYGAGIDADETVPAVVAKELAARGRVTPVFNTAAAGGLPRTPVPFTAAVSSHPVELLMVEVLVPSYAERRTVPPPVFSNDQRAMLLAAAPASQALLEAADYDTSFGQRVEVRISSFVTRYWRAFRLRGALWIDENFEPNLLVWSLRRWAAQLGILPKRFEGQTTNIGKLPWREAYRGKKPGKVQRIRVPSPDVLEPAYEQLVLTQKLANAAGVPVVFFEVPANIPFQREFGLMDEAAIERFETVRSSLFERMRADGLEIVEAPPFPDDGFLDKAHVTPLGAELLAQQLVPVIEARLPARKAEK